MSNPTKILFGVLSHGERDGWIHPSVFQFFCNVPFVTGYAFQVIQLFNYKPAAAARNMFGFQQKDSEADWICMIDNDMGIPLNLLDSVKDAPEDADIVAPSFYAWDQTTLTLRLCWGGLNTPMDGIVTNLEPGYHKVSKVGTGVIFIRPHVFKAMKYPYFTYVYNDHGAMTGTEDIQFCLQARSKGFNLYGNSAVTIGHYHTVEIGSMWQWLDKHKNLSVDSSQKDSGRSPEQSVEACSAEAP